MYTLNTIMIRIIEFGVDILSGQTERTSGYSTAAYLNVVKWIQKSWPMYYMGHDFWIHFTTDSIRWYYASSRANHSSVGFIILQWSLAISKVPCKHSPDGSMKTSDPFKRNVWNTLTIEWLCIYTYKHTLLPIMNNFDYVLGCPTASRRMHTVRSVQLYCNELLSLQQPLLVQYCSTVLCVSRIACWKKWKIIMFFIYDTVRVLEQSLAGKPIYHYMILSSKRLFKNIVFQVQSDTVL